MLKRVEIVIKWLVPIIVLSVLYIQIKSDSKTISSIINKIDFSFRHMTLLVFATLLMFGNWFLESLKWKILIKNIVSISFKEAVFAILNGLAFGLFTPFRVGDIVTRIGHLSVDNRSNALGSIFVVRSSQLIATIIAGLVGIYFYSIEIYNRHFEWILILVILCALVFYNVKKTVPIVSKIPFVNKYLQYIHIMNEYNIYDYTITLIISLIRYTVIIVQYFLIFQLFDIQISFFTVFIGISITLLVKSILPIVSIVGDFGVRELVAVYVYSKLGFAPTEIILVTISIWILNVVTPSVIGSFLTKKLNVI